MQALPVEAAFWQAAALSLRVRLSHVAGRIVGPAPRDRRSTAGTITTSPCARSCAHGRLPASRESDRRRRIILEFCTRRLASPRGNAILRRLVGEAGNPAPPISAPDGGGPDVRRAWLRGRKNIHK